tara:strand:- start:443 stop:2371 length:1929 start_codon:yes stop_codon:yes gene_type:complete
MLGLGLGTTQAQGLVDALAQVTNTKSIIFDGADEYISISDSDNLSFGDGSSDSAFSVSAWVKMTDASGFPILSKTGFDPNTEWGFGCNGSDLLYLKLMDNDTDVYIRRFSAALTIYEGNWIHVAATYDGSSSTSGMHLYVNGVLADDSVATLGTYNAMHQTSADLYIGHTKYNASGTIYSEGNIDEVAIWNKELTADEITQIYNGGTANLDLSTDSGDYSSSANIKGWWRMGDEASTRVADANANNLVIPDMRKTFFSGKSIDFDGSNDYIQLSDPFNYTQHTISAWFKVIDDGNEKLIFENVDGTSDGIHLRLNSSEQIKYKLNNTTISSTSTGLSGSWHHVVVTYDGTTYCLYLNGVLETTGTVSQTIDVTTNARIGSSSAATANYFEGKLCDVAIWDAALNANTVASIYNSGEPNDLTLAASYTAGSGTDKSGDLQGYWRMGNGTLDDGNIAGNGLIADQTNATLGTELVTSISSWTNAADITTTIDSSTNTVTMESDDSSSAAATRFYNTATSTGILAGQLPLGVHKISFTASWTVAPNVKQLKLYPDGSLDTYNITSGENVYYTNVTDLNNNHQFSIQFNDADGDITLANISCKPVNGNAGIMTNMSQYDIVDHAPNRNSGDMINFDATSDIETDTP